MQQIIRMVLLAAVGLAASLLDSGLSRALDKAPSQTMLTTVLNPVAPNQPLVFTVEVYPVEAVPPTGKVAFFVSGQAFGERDLAVSNLGVATASITVPNWGVGNYSVIASYAGDTNFSSSRSLPVEQIISKYPTTTSVIAMQNPTPYRSRAELRAMVNGRQGGQNPDGLGNLTLLIDGKAVYSLPGADLIDFGIDTLSVGSHALVAEYAGNSINAASTSSTLTLNVVAADTSTTLSSLTNPAVVGSAVVYHVQVQGTRPPDGTVTLFSDVTGSPVSKALGADGTVLFPTTYIAPLQANVYAVYAGNTQWKSSTSATLVQNVVKAATAIAVTSSANPARTDSTVILTARVTGYNATGSMTFYQGDKKLATRTLSNAAATFRTPKLKTGKNEFTAKYSGDDGNEASTSAVFNQRARPPK